MCSALLAVVPTYTYGCIIYIVNSDSFNVFLEFIIIIQMFVIFLCFVVLSLLT